MSQRPTRIVVPVLEAHPGLFAPAKHRRGMYNRTRFVHGKVSADTLACLRRLAKAGRL